MSALCLAAEAVGQVGLPGRWSSRVLRRRLWHVLEHIRDARPMSRVFAPVAVDVLSSLRGMVAPRGLVRARRASVTPDLTMHEAMDNPSAWRLRYEVWSVRAILLLVGGVRHVELNPEVHLYLGERYERLADHLARRGARARASQLGVKAQWHYAQAGFDDFPRAAAMAMPVPRPRMFTEARGRDIERGDPKDAA